MIIIRNRKTKKEERFPSYNAACDAKGSNSPKNAKNAKKFLNAQGFDIVKTEPRAITAAKRDLYEAAKKIAADVDEDAIKELEKQREKIAANVKGAEDMEKIVKINADIEKLQNPTVTLEDIKAAAAAAIDERNELEK